VSRKVAAFLAGLALAAGLVGCANSSPGPGAASGVDVTVNVFAAASLKSSFTQLAETFEAQHPGTRVALSFAGSSDLAAQISQGAPADVFAAADIPNMGKVVDAGLADGEPKIFATNTLAIAVPPGNPAGISSFPDLASNGIRLVTCAKQVPCGAAAATVAEKHGTALSPVSEENSVADVLGKVTSGEADAGLVYATDVRAVAGKVESIPFPEAADAVNSYPIATLTDSSNKDAAAAFLDLVTGAEGRKVLEQAGFGPGNG
jgi:molybdate transport system substrate-binding protein